MFFLLFVFFTRSLSSAFRPAECSTMAYECVYVHAQWTRYVMRCIYLLWLFVYMCVSRALGSQYLRMSITAGLSTCT